MNTSKHAFTAGPAEVDGVVTIDGIKTSAGVYKTTDIDTDLIENDLICKASYGDAEFIAEAFTVTHEIGLTPRQLADDLRATKGILAATRERVCHLEVERDELRKERACLAVLLQNCQRILERDFPNGQLVADVRAALAKTCPS
jgi:hypothetical protein